MDCPECGHSVDEHGALGCVWPVWSEADGCYLCCSCETPEAQLRELPTARDAMQASGSRGLFEGED